MKKGRPSTSIQLPCNFCQTSLSLPPSKIKRNRSKRFFCNKNCESQYSKGINNPNFGKNWTNEQKTKQSILIKSKVSEEIRWKSGSANRGKKLSDDIRSNMSKSSRRLNVWNFMADPKEAKRKIAETSSARWKCPEYRKNQRKVRERLGSVIPLELKSDYDIYFKESEWLKSVNPLIENIKTFYDDPRKYVRDHRYGRKAGFINGVFPEILRHPSNAKIISRSENVSKRMKGNREDISISLENLFTMIKSYDKQYEEQEICIKRISEYELGSRWTRDKEVQNNG